MGWFQHREHLLMRLDQTPNLSALCDLFFFFRLNFWLLCSCILRKVDNWIEWEQCLNSLSCVFTYSNLHQQKGCTLAPHRNGRKSRSYCVSINGVCWFPLLPCICPLFWFSQCISLHANCLLFLSYNFCSDSKNKWVRMNCENAISPSISI